MGALRIKTSRRIPCPLTLAVVRNMPARGARASRGAPARTLACRVPSTTHQTRKPASRSMQVDGTLLPLGHSLIGRGCPWPERRTPRGASEEDFEAKTADDHLAGTGGRRHVTVSCRRRVRRDGNYWATRRPSRRRCPDQFEPPARRGRDFRRQPVDVLRVRQGKRGRPQARRSTRARRLRPMRRLSRLWPMRRLRRPRLRRLWWLRLGHLRRLRLRP